MNKPRAIVYADRFFHCADGKTAHGLVRYSRRYDIVCVVDSTMPEGDAGMMLDGNLRDIPLLHDLNTALDKTNPDTFIVGAVSEGGVLPKGYDKAVEWALLHNLNVVSGLHQFLSDNIFFATLAQRHGCTIIDVRKLYSNQRRFYSGKIKDVKSTRIALLGTDSAIGKRTVSVMLVEELCRRGRKADMIFTGQTGWLQGWPHGVVIDAMINDFVAGGIEGAILDSWKDERPEFMVIEGQGSLVHPFFPGGFEILAAGQIHGYILVHAPGRQHLDGFPGYPMPDPKRVVTIARTLSEQPLVGISINRENLNENDVKVAKQKLSRTFHVITVEPISDSINRLVDVLEDRYTGYQ